MLNKYITVFKTSWQNILTYRFNFLMGQLRSIIILILLYYIWAALSYKTGKFAGYSACELTTYVFLATIMKSVIFGPHICKIAEEINDGTFSKYLCMPISFPLFAFFRSLAEKTIYLISAIIEVSVFFFILKEKIFFQTNFKQIIFFFLSLTMAYFIYFILSFCIELLAFWSREAHCPIFLFTWISEFTSGEFYPIDIIFPSLFSVLKFLPFAYVLFYPAMIYLRIISGGEIIKVILIQLFWIMLFAFFALFVWKKGLKKYSGEGI
ncbi:MAG: ABC-2 family transporter protein [bacterium]